MIRVGMDVKGDCWETHRYKLVSPTVCSHVLICNNMFWHVPCSIDIALNKLIVDPTLYKYTAAAKTHLSLVDEAGSENQLTVFVLTISSRL